MKGVVKPQHIPTRRKDRIYAKGVGGFVSSGLLSMAEISRQ